MLSDQRNHIIYRICGDQSLTLEFGDEVNLFLNFKAIIMKDVIKTENIKGIRDIFVARCSILLMYDSSEIGVYDLIARLKELENEKINYLSKSISSRLIRVPVLFNDRWTRECSKAHNLPPDLESIAEYNGLSIEEFIKDYTSSDYWVNYVGFSPGLVAFNVLDPEKEFRSPQLKVPRTWTVPGSVGVHRSGNSIHAVNTPGGVKMAGRTPLLIFDINQKNPVFKESPVLFKPGDRLKLISITEREYGEIEKHIDSYKYDIQDGVYWGRSLAVGECS